MNQPQTLDTKIRKIVAREREALAELIVELRNLESIEGYIDLGFRNMFEYLTKGLGLSNGSAQRRIDAARLSRDIPALSSMLKSGAVEFHHVTTLSMAVRQVRKKRKVSAEDKLQLLERVAGHTEAQTQQAVAAFFDLDVVHKTKRVVQKDESVRIELVLSKSEAERIEQAQALVSHAGPTKDLSAYLIYVSELIIKEKTKAAAGPAASAATAKAEASNRTAASAKPTPTVVAEASSRASTPLKSTATKTVKSAAASISARVHRIVRNKQPKCVKCGSGWFPQTDHRKSKWAGGTNEIENLQTLCGPCNRAKYYGERSRRSAKH